ASRPVGGLLNGGGRHSSKALPSDPGTNPAAATGDGGVRMTAARVQNCEISGATVVVCSHTVGKRSDLSRWAARGQTRRAFGGGEPQKQLDRTHVDPVCYAKWPTKFVGS